MSETEIQPTEAVDLDYEIEDEGVSASQIFGIMFVTVASIFVSVLVAYFVWFVPTRDRAAEAAENVPGDRYVDQRELRAAAENKLSHYSRSTETEGRFLIPIDAAMSLMIADSTGRPINDASMSRASYNLGWLRLSTPEATMNAFSGAASPNVEERVDGEGELGPDVEPEVLEEGESQPDTTEAH